MIKRGSDSFLFGRTEMGGEGRRGGGEGVTAHDCSGFYVSIPFLTLRCRLNSKNYKIVVVLFLFFFSCENFSER